MQLDHQLYQYQRSLVKGWLTHQDWESLTLQGDPRFYLNLTDHMVIYMNLHPWPVWRSFRRPSPTHRIQDHTSGWEYQGKQLQQLSMPYWVQVRYGKSYIGRDVINNYPTKITFISACHTAAGTPETDHFISKPKTKRCSQKLSRKHRSSIWILKWRSKCNPQL